jgi:hypothetical protein
MTISDIFLENKPNLKGSTVDSYITVLKAIGKSIGKVISKPSDVKSDINQIIEAVLNPDLTVRSRRLRLSVLLSFIGKNYPELTTLLRKNLQDEKMKLEKLIESHKKSPKQEAAWLDWKIVVDKYRKLEAEVKPLFKDAAKLSSSDFKKVQLYVILSCYVLICPRRSLDYTEFKIRNVSPEDVNFNRMDGLNFVFNVFKTAKWEGPQIIKIPGKLKSIITRWATINPYDWLIVGNRGKKIGTSRLNRLFTDFFYPKKLGPQLLRHIYITGNLETATYAEMKKVAKDMGHSVEVQQMEYLKNK